MKYAFGTEQTYQWIAKSLGDKKLSILEVGAGQGRLAARLRAEGFDVTAIDRSEKAVAKAKDVGVTVLQADALKFLSQKIFDVGIFVMCAHHLHPIDAAFARIAKSLKPNAQVMIDDFALEEVDAATARWFYSLRSDLCGDPVPGDPLLKWQEEHVHEPKLYSGKEIINAAEAIFGKVSVEHVPYFYKYLAARALDAKWLEGLAKQLFTHESKLISEGKIRPIGIRIRAGYSNG